MSSELLKRKKELDEEFEEVMEMEDDAINARSKMTIAAVAKLIAVLHEHIIDMAEIANKKKYYDENLTTALQKTVSDLVTAFSQIKTPEIPEIKVTPNINIDFKPLADKINQSNNSIIALLNKVIANSGNNKNEELYKIIVAMVNKNNAFVEKSFEQLNYTKNFEGIETAINKTPFSWEHSITDYNRDGRIEKIISKPIIKK